MVNNSKKKEGVRRGKRGLLSGRRHCELRKMIKIRNRILLQNSDFPSSERLKPSSTESQTQKLPFLARAVRVRPVKPVAAQLYLGYSHLLIQTFRLS